MLDDLVEGIKSCERNSRRNEPGNKYKYKYKGRCINIYILGGDQARDHA